mgnify:CR=1 FL=1
MLRTLVLFLVLANAAWFAWAQGFLQPWGIGPTPQSEPERLERQLRPDALRVQRAGGQRNPAPANPAAPAAPAPASRTTS